MPNNNDNYEYMKFLDLSGAQQIWNTAKQTFVQTVNGVGIDANGNVNVGSGSFTEHEVQFVKDEYNKTLNLFDKNAYPFQNLGANGSYSANNLFTGCFLLLKAGTYTLSFNRPSETQFAVFGCSRPTYDANTYSVFDEGWKTPENDTYTFTFTQDLYFGIYVYKSGGIVPSLYNDLNIMLNKGSSALPYQEYNGVIAHLGKINNLVYQANESTTFNAETYKTLLSSNLEQGHLYLVNGFVDLNISSNEIMSAIISVRDGTTERIKRNVRTTASNGGGCSICIFVDTSDYASPNVELNSYNYTGQNNVPVCGTLEIIKLK